MTAKPNAQDYISRLMRVLETVRTRGAESIREAGRLCARAIDEDGMIYLFGTGHSHMLAEEGHYRAGGLACVCPILSSSLMLHEGAAASTQLERTAGVAAHLLSRYAMQSCDVLILFSNSGVNAVPVEVCHFTATHDIPLIAVTSLNYSLAVRRDNAKTVADYANVVIDNHLPPGDALLPIDERQNTGPGSTVVGAMILNAILTEALGQAQTTELPVYISANMPGARDHNAKLVRRFRARNPHL